MPTASPKPEEVHAHVSTLISASNCYPLLGFELNGSNTKALNLSFENQDLAAVDLSNTEAFTTYIKQYQAPYKVGIGGYNEHRSMYRRSEVFGPSDEARCIHLGTDLWSDAYTQVYAPLDGVVHSFANNAAFGDYGATIILQHELGGHVFYTLYGHLSLASIAKLEVGQKFGKGYELCQFGEPHENGNWPPHLHFQVMTDLLGKTGDFPGVAAKSERAFYLNICLDPNLIIGFK